MPRTAPAYVYIIECAGYSKIGIAQDPVKRLAGINTGAPVQAVLYAKRLFDDRLIAHNIESRLHQQFRDLRTNGEWFDLPPAAARDALMAMKAHRLRDRSKRHDTVERWDVDAPADIASLLTRPTSPRSDFIYETALAMAEGRATPGQVKEAMRLIDAPL